MAGARPADGQTENEVQLSPLGEHDAPAFFGIYSVVRSEELGLDSWDGSRRDHLLRFQFEAQWRGYRSEFPHADTRVITRGGSPIGWVIVDRSGAALHGIDIALLASERSQGIGTQVIWLLQEEAAAAARPMVITVNRFNHRAMALYGRLGFSVTGETDVHLFMEWHA